MGNLALSGVLKRPITGEVVPNARITFDAIATGNILLKGVSSSSKTLSDGSYSVNLEYGDYAIQVSWSGQTLQYGTVHVDDTTPIGSLNDLLMQQIIESQLTPEIVLEFRQLEQQMQEDLQLMEQLNEDAGLSATAADASANAAKTSETNSAASEQAAAGSAADAAASAASIEGDAQRAAESATSAAESETNAETSSANAGVSERNAAISEDNAATSANQAAMSQDAASISDVNTAASASAAASSQAAAAISESNSATSAQNSAVSETNAENARNAAEEYAQEAKEAASQVTSPLTDQGVWAIQSGYPTKPGNASIWQVTDGGVDPVNPEIIWDAGDMLVYLASADTWCRLLGQAVVAGEPKPIKFDSDIILNVGAGLQIITSGTNIANVAKLDTDNSLVLGDGLLPGINLLAADATNMFVLVSDGSGGYTKSRIFTEQFPPPAVDTSHLVPDTRTINSHNLAQDVSLTSGDVGAVSVNTTVNGHALSSNIVITSQDIFNSQAIPIGDAQDLNTYTTPGLYYQSANAQAGTGANYPEANAGSLEIYKNAGITQVYRTYNSSRCYVRSLYGSAWTLWAKIYDAANPPPYPVTSVNGMGGAVNIDVGYTPSNPPPSGQTITGNYSAYYTHSNGQIFLQAIGGIASNSSSNPDVTVHLPASFANGILGISGSFSGNGGDDSDSWWTATAAGLSVINLHTRNCSGTWSFVVAGY